MKRMGYKVCSIFLIGVLLASCNNDDSFDPNRVENELFLEVASTKVLRNQRVDLSVLDAEALDNTDKAAFYVDGLMLEGTVFSSPTEGIFEIYAEYNLAGTVTRTATATIDVFIPKRKVLVEDYTGTWCGQCPRMTTLIEQAQTLTTDISIVSIHGNSIFTGTDPFTIEEGMFLKNYFEVQGYPTGIIDRDAFWNEQDIEPQIVDAAGLETDLSIAMNSSIQGDELTVNVELISELEMTDLNLVVFLLEDNLIADQRSYFNLDPTSPYYQQGDTLVGFKHDHVLRMSLTEPLGDEISVTSSLESYQKSLVTTLPSELDREALSLVAFVTNRTTHKALNSQHARVNTSKAFE